MGSLLTFEKLIPFEKLLNPPNKINNLNSYPATIPPDNSSY